MCFFAGGKHLNGPSVTWPRGCSGRTALGHRRRVGQDFRPEVKKLTSSFNTWVSLFSHLFTGFIALPPLTSHFSVDGPVVKPLCFCPLILPALSCLQLNGTQADVAECLEFTKAVPSITQPCQLPCQDDCQLTNWSKFSSCTVDCVGVRIRKRALIGGNRTVWLQSYSSDAVGRAGTVSQFLS